jgi:hypothetical protein
VKLITRHLVPKFRMVELYFHSPICFQGIVLNYIYIFKYRDSFAFTANDKTGKCDLIFTEVG